MPLTFRVLTILAWAAFAAIGCGSTQVRNIDEYDPGNTPHSQFLKGAALCDKQAETDEKSMGGTLDPTHGTYNRMFDACMRANGWTRRPTK